MKVKEMNNTLFTALANIGEIECITSSNAPILNMDYFTFHSAEKTLLDVVENMVNSSPSTYIEDLAKIINLKFKDKWNSIFISLYGEYNPLTTEKYSEIETPNITKTKQISEDKAKNEESSSTNTISGENKKVGTNTDTKQGTKENTENTISSQKEGTDLVTTDDKEKENRIYGFNSNVGVGSDESNDTATRNITGNKEDNTIDINEDKTRSEEENSTLSRNINETDTKTENATLAGTRDITETNSLDTTEKESGTRNKEYQGYKNISPQELAQKEIELKNLYNLYNIIYEDVDSVIALGIYC